MTNHYRLWKKTSPSGWKTKPGALGVSADTTGDTDVDIHEISPQLWCVSIDSDTHGCYEFLCRGDLDYARRQADAFMDALGSK